MNTTLVTAADVDAAARRIAPLIHRTPVVTSRWLDERVGASVFLKCENLQRVGAFKMRGASNAVALLSAAERSRGVVTHSSGNHAQALALAARTLGVGATIVMPENAPSVKRDATAAYGARILTCRPTQADRERTAQAVVDEEGAVLIHPYDDARIVAGQGTAARELLEQVTDLDAILAPVGGGGLLAGTTIAATRAGVTVLGVEPAGADDAWRSLRSGQRVREHTPSTICDGLLTCLGELPFRILSRHGVRILRVDDDAVRTALRFLLERTKLVVEPSAAVPVAALLEGGVADVPGAETGRRRIGVILSGGNLDLDGLPALLGR